MARAVRIGEVADESGLERCERRFEIGAPPLRFAVGFVLRRPSDETHGEETIDWTDSELVADELVPNGRVPDSYRPHVLDNPGGLYNGCMEFHLADDVLVLYYPPAPRDVIHLRVIRTHEELSTGRYSREWPRD